MVEAVTVNAFKYRLDKHCSNQDVLFGRPFVKRFALCLWSVVCLSVTFVHCGQTVGRIKMKLGMQVGLSPGHIVLDGDPTPLPKKGAEPPNFRPLLIVVKRLYGSKWHLAWRWALVQATLC